MAIMADGGPDWAVIGGAVGTVLIAAGGIAAGMRGAFKGQATEAEQRQEKRDTAANVNSAQTLDATFRLVDALQEEVGNKTKDIDRMLVRIGTLETEIRDLRTTQLDLEQRIRTLREQLQKQKELDP